LRRLRPLQKLPERYRAFRVQQDQQLDDDVSNQVSADEGERGVKEMENANGQKLGYFLSVSLFRLFLFLWMRVT